MTAANQQLACECKRELETMLAVKYAESCTGTSNVRAELQGYGFGMAEPNQVVTLGYMEVKYTADWAMKKGGVRKKTYKGTMIFSYCPFCGKKAGE